MKKFSILFLIYFSISVFGQSKDKIIRDLDGDKKNDTVRIDHNSQTIICVLSTQKYKKIKSGTIQKLNFGNMLVSTKKGFEFWNDFDRSGFRCVFEYNPQVKKMQLVQMRRIDDILSYDYGEKSKGQSTVNLITNEYTGNFYRVKNGILQKIPTIKTKMVFPKAYLETFDDSLCFAYEARCLALYRKNGG